MEKSSQSFLCSLIFVLLLLLPSFSESQLTPRETRILFQIQKLLEYPPSVQSWSNWTNFCCLPPSPSLKIVCSNNHVTELTVTGNKTSSSNSKLSERFSIDSFFTVLTKLSTVKYLSLVSLGIWGPLPPKINRLSSLEVLNLSSNFLSGEIPKEIASFKNLESLVLSDNLFEGSVPDLRGLTNLEDLNLSGNRLGPEFPSIGSNLVTVSLKNNSFRSEIPVQLKKLNKLQRLDLSSNNFLGWVPEFLFSLPSIQNISLARNRLSGLLPNSSCTSKFKFLDISHNLLTGKLQSCFVSKSSPNRTVLYSFNCLSIANAKYQRPISFCQKQAVAVKPTPIEQKKDSKIQLGLVLGIIGGVVAITAALTLLILVVMRRSEREISEGNKFDRHVADRMAVSSSSPKPVPDPRRVPQTMRSAVIGLPPYRVFTLEEIEDATNNFDTTNLVDEQLYKGCLREGVMVMVKCIKLKKKSYPQSLAQQMEVLSKLRHMHLASVLGHCIVTYQDHPYAGSTIYVVQEYISNGSLRDYLSDWRKKEMLKWPQRMATSIGIARGIQFLHTGVAPGIFGNDLKTENILLDETLTAKISGYNIPLPSMVGAESPLHGNQTLNLASNKNAVKEDVYQFGVILLEVITGRVVMSLSELEELRTQMENGLAEGGTELRSMIDPAVRGTYAFESLRTTAEFTISCLCADPNKRPSIEDVVWNLQYTIQVQEGWTSSGNLGLGTQM